MNNHIQVTLKSSTIEMNLNSPEESIYLVPELEGLTTLPEIRTSSGVNAGADGGWTSAQLFDARLISMRLVIANEDIAVVESKRRLLNTLLAQGRNEELALNITTEAGNAYTVNVRVTSVSASLDRVLHKQDFLIQFRADDPLIYGSTEGGGVEAILNVQRALGGFAIPFTFPLAIGGGSDGTVVQNVGTETVYPVITLYGNLHSPTVINRTTNQQLQIIADLASDIIWGQSQTAQGEYIQITNDLDISAELASVEMLGKAEQDGTPTPDSPVSVEVVTGENVVKTEGKNLLNIPDSTNTSAGVTFTASNGTLTASGTTTRGSYAENDSIFPTLTTYGNYSNYANITEANSIELPAGTYTASAEITKTGETSAGVAFCTGATMGARVTGVTKLEVLINDATGTYTKTATFTIAEGERLYVSTYYEGNSTKKNVGFTISNIQLEKGNQASQFEPYHGQEFEVNLGKNLLSLADGTATTSSVTATISNQMITLTGMTSESWGFNIKAGNNALPADIPAGSYTIVLNQTLTFPMTLVLRSSDTTQYYSARIEAGNRTLTFAINFDAHYYTLWCPAPLGTTTNIQGLGVCLQKSGDSTTYAPYFTPIELAKIGDYQDRIYKDSGKWYIEKQIGKLNMADITGWSYSSAGSLYSMDFTTAHNAKVDTTLSNIFTHDWTAWAGTGKFGITSSGNLWIMTGDTSVIVSNVNTWLSDKNAIMYYVLATPTTTEITNDALIAQLDALGASSLYLGVNNIGTETLNAVPTLDIGYYTSYERQTDVVVIDSQANTITLNGLDIYNLMTEGSEFIEIAPGDNIMLLTSTQTSDDGYAEVKYKQGYLSI